MFLGCRFYVPCDLQGSQGVPVSRSSRCRGAGPSAAQPAETSLSDASEGCPSASVPVAGSAGSAAAPLSQANLRVHEDPGPVEDAPVSTSGPASE